MIRNRDTYEGFKRALEEEGLKWDKMKVKRTGLFEEVQGDWEVLVIKM